MWSLGQSCRACYLKMFSLCLSWLQTTGSYPFFFLVFHSPAKWVFYSSFTPTYFTHVNGVNFITLTGQRSDNCHIRSLPCVGPCKICPPPKFRFLSFKFIGIIQLLWFLKMFYANFVFMHSVFLVWSGERIYKLPVDRMYNTEYHLKRWRHLETAWLCVLG